MCGPVLRNWYGGRRSRWEAGMKRKKKNQTRRSNGWAGSSGRFCGWIALLNQPLQDDEYKSVLISGLAILGMREDDGWLDAEDYTPKYSAVIKLARLTVIQEAYERRREAIAHYESRGLSAKKARDEADSHYVLTRRLVHAFMTMAHDGKDPSSCSGYIAADHTVSRSGIPPRRKGRSNGLGIMFYIPRSGLV
ncbi:hypothetical protein DL98DRAFT_599739 [Cadophora sp. DSE1049]|nr:hypothetical protein DL98DRAFT_599739 [Cadophora sp. DSE1049]